jgi:hypothetical protein
MFGGSWAKNSKEMAIAFSKNTHLNVSLVASHEQRKEVENYVESGDMTFISLPHSMSQSYP